MSCKTQLKNILVVDDNQFTAEALALRFNLFIKNSRIFTAGNGAEAVEIMKTHPVDLVLTDIRMPVMDGYELLAHCRKNYPRVLLSAMTADYRPDVLKRIHELGADVCFEKPFDFDEVARAVRDLLGSGRRVFEQLSRRLASMILSAGYL